jgi:hypothetical protein
VNGLLGLCRLGVFWASAPVVAPPLQDLPRQGRAQQVEARGGGTMLR